MILDAALKYLKSVKFLQFKNFEDNLFVPRAATIKPRAKQDPKNVKKIDPFLKRFISQQFCFGLILCMQLPHCRNLKKNNKSLISLTF